MQRSCCYTQSVLYDAHFKLKNRQLQFSWSGGDWRREECVYLQESVDKTIVWLYFGQNTKDILSLV